jgi:hypothetical protein
VPVLGAMLAITAAYALSVELTKRLIRPRHAPRKRRFPRR